MYYITECEERPDGYFNISDSRQWVPWLAKNIPQEVAPQIRRRLNSNLSHLIVGLELKAALIEAHFIRTAGQRPLLFEPYAQNFNLEFCVAAFSVLEGLGSAHWLAQNGEDGATGPRISRDQWQPVLDGIYDENGEYGLNVSVEATLAVRDKLHQDRLGDIDWHALSYEDAFVPARGTIATLLLREADAVPENTNLR
jgi:hypothetical protein